MTEAKIENLPRIVQGDIISDVEFVESAEEKDGEIIIDKIIFPLVLVLSQECDLTWDYESRNDEKRNQDKYLFSIIVAPLYNYEHFINGEHLQDLSYSMGRDYVSVKKSPNKMLRNNEIPRFHYLEFDQSVPVVNSVIDFKHYFTVGTEKLREHKRTHYVCTVDVLYRERISQRFSEYLSRIGLPDNSDKQTT